MRRVRQSAALLFLIVLVVLASQTRGVTSAETDEWEVRMEYAQVVRAGQPTPLEFVITSDSPITEPVSVVLCGSWFDAMDFQNWYPVPSSESRAGDALTYEFDPSEDTTMTVALDARSAPGQLGARLPCDVSIESAGRETLTSSFTTWRLP